MADTKAAKTVGPLLEDLDAVDVCASRTSLAPAHHRLHRVGLTFEHGFDRAVRVVADPPGDVA